MLAWACTLIRLYKDIEHSEKLLPNKRIFIQHGSLLFGFLFLYALDQTMFLIAKNSDNYNTFLILTGICDIFISIESLLEMMTFFLVVKLMLPITPSDKDRRSKFQRFLFKGFADKNELRAAVLANNPDMDLTQMSIMDNELTMLSSFIESA